MAHIKSTSTTWSGVFEEEKYTKEGSGIAGEGEITQVRFHSVSCSRDVRRYVAVVISLSFCHQRVYDKHGLEEKPRLHGLSALRKDWKGFVPKEKNDPIPLQSDALLSLIGANGKAIPVEFHKSDHLHPTVADSFEFWGEANATKSLNLEKGDKVHFSTRGDSHFLEHINRDKQGQFGKFNASEQEVLGGWATKLNQVGEMHAGKPLDCDKNEGVDSDEWSD
mmetsp:Transcript_19372/g.54390  ORF Transcript_19372/g.54390 Transcript_19372/m.54390 type:complete len:222 (-) Transcript_19372:101-766(-)